MDEATQETVRRHIGVRIRYARDLDGVASAEKLAEQLSDYTGEMWSRNVMANIETGRKELSFTDLLAIAKVQQRPIGWYLQDAPDTISHDLPGYRGLLTEAAVATLDLTDYHSDTSPPARSAPRTARPGAAAP